jgi:phospholipase C
MSAKPSRTWKTKLAALTASTILTTLGAAPSYADSASTATPIKHIVVVFEENVSFDHYFGTYPYAANPKGEPGFGNCSPRC